MMMILFFQIVVFWQSRLGVGFRHPVRLLEANMAFFFRSD